MTALSQSWPAFFTSAAPHGSMLQAELSSRSPDNAAMSRRLPPMVVTVEIRGGPTVRLDYDPARGHGDVIACTRITVRSEIPPSAPRCLCYLLAEAEGLLCPYADSHQQSPAHRAHVAHQAAAPPGSGRLS